MHRAKLQHLCLVYTGKENIKYFIFHFKKMWMIVFQTLAKMEEPALTKLTLTIVHVLRELLGKTVKPVSSCRNGICIKLHEAKTTLQFRCRISLNECTKITGESSDYTCI